MNLSVTDRPSWSRSSCRHCHSWPCWGPTWWSCPPLFSLSLSCPPAPCQPPTSHHITAHGTQVWRPAGRDNLRDDSLWVTSDRDVCEALRWAAENSCGPGGSIGELAASRLPCLQLSCKPPPCLSTTTSPWFSCFGLEIGRYMFVTRNLKANGKQKKMDSVSRLPCLQLSCPQTSCTQHPCSSAGPFGKFERT